MGVVEKWFSTSAAGDETGSSWENRAALITGGAWSTVLTGFDFSGSDSLVCMIEGGNTYTAPASFESARFTTAAPTLLNPLYFRACDSSGNALAVPDPSWVSCKPMWTATGMPLFDCGSSTLFNLDYCHLVLCDFTGSRNGHIVSVPTSSTMQWCRVKNTGAGTSGLAATLTGRVSDCWFECTNAFASVISHSSVLLNCRLQGGGSGGSGNRKGITGTIIYDISRCTIANCNGAALELATTTASRENSINCCTIANNGGVGIDLDLTSGTATAHTLITNCMITGNAAGIDLNNTILASASGNRLRDNTSGNIINAGNYPVDVNNYVTDSDDATEFVDAAGGDFRIKASSAIWGKGYGAGDEIPTAAAIATAVWVRSGRSLTA